MKVQRNPLLDIKIKNNPWFHSSFNTINPVPILDFSDPTVFKHPALRAAPNLQPQQKALLLIKDENPNYSLYIGRIKKGISPLDQGIFNVLQNYFRIDEIISMHDFLTDYDFERLQGLTSRFINYYRKHSFLKELNYRLIKHRIIEESDFIVPPVSMRGAMEASNYLGLRVHDVSKNAVKRALKNRGIVSHDDDLRRWMYWNGFAYVAKGRPTEETHNRRWPTFVFRASDTVDALNIRKYKKVGKITIPNTESGISQEILQTNGNVEVPLWRIEDLIYHYIIEGNSQRKDKVIHRIYFAGGFLPDYSRFKKVISSVFPNVRLFQPGAGLVWANQVKNKQ